MRKRRKNGRFQQIFLCFLLVLIVLVSACLLYVHRLLTTYEESQPERLVEQAIATLAQKAEDRTLFGKDTLVTDGTLEEGMDLPSLYAHMIKDPETRYTTKAGLHEANELVYTVKSKDGIPLAEITLEAVGEPVTKLAVFTWQEWKLRSVEPVFAPKTYTLTVPEAFTVTVNGIILSGADGTPAAEGSVLYTLNNLHVIPEVQIIGEGGEKAEYSVKGDRIIPVIYDYNLTLPSALSLTLNGTPMEGTETENGYRLYDICLLQKPEVAITDPYGNTVLYEGGNTLPLTYLTVDATELHTVRVNGALVPDDSVTYRSNPEYEAFAEYVTDLPRLASYTIAVLQDKPVIQITDPKGNVIPVEKGTRTLDLTEFSGEDTIPAEIAAEVDPLAIAKKWSLFVSKDLAGQNYGLYEIAQYLIPNSYQYKIATNYAYGIDITFTSIHTLKDPPFTDETVTNFIRITEDCFSVDVSFSKHMILSNGELVDSMNERLYFVKYDDPANDWDTPAWKLASMKEMSTNAE